MISEVHKKCFELFLTFNDIFEIVNKMICYQRLLKLRLKGCFDNDKNVIESSNKTHRTTASNYVRTWYESNKQAIIETGKISKMEPK